MDDTDNPIPHRRHRLVLDLEGDDLKALSDALYDLSLETEWGKVTERTSGGVTSGYHVNITTDENVTAESFQEALRAWHRAKHPERVHADA